MRCDGAQPHVAEHPDHAPASSSRRSARAAGRSTAGRRRSRRGSGTAAAGRRRARGGRPAPPGRRAGRGACIMPKQASTTTSAGPSPDDGVQAVLPQLGQPCAAVRARVLRPPFRRAAARRRRPGAPGPSRAAGPARPAPCPAAPRRRRPPRRAARARSRRTATSAAAAAGPGRGRRGREQLAAGLLPEVEHEVTGGAAAEPAGDGRRWRGGGRGRCGARRSRVDGSGGSSRPRVGGRAGMRGA